MFYKTKTKPKVSEKRGNLSEFHSERSYLLQNWYFSKIINQKKSLNQNSGSFSVNFRFQAEWKMSRAEPKILQLGSDSSLKYVRTYLSLDQEKHVQISFLMEKACYHVQLPQRPSMIYKKKFLDYHSLKTYSLLISSDIIAYTK